MENRGIEPRLLGCRPSVLPLSLVPRLWLRRWESNPPMAAYEIAVCPSSSSPHQNVVREAGVEPAASRLSIECSNRAELFPDGAPRQTRTDFLALQKRSIASNACGAQNLEPAERIERSSDAYRASALPLSYTGWSRRADSNRHLSVTRARFFPLNYFDLERVTGFEPVSGPWQGPILAARRYPLGASGENRTLLASLEGWNSANKSHSLEIHLLTFNCQRAHFGGSA